MTGLADALRESTRELHTKAERSGIVGAIIRRQVDIYGYALFLRNLLPAYVELERGLESPRRATCIAPLALPEVYRRRAIEADLNAICDGNCWREELPLLPAGSRYAMRISALADVAEGGRLVAHAYTRYLGDMNGGQTLRRLLSDSLGLDRRGLSFYRFPKISDLDRFKADYRAAIDRAAADISDFETVLDEARACFQLNIDVSEAVENASRNRH